MNFGEFLWSLFVIFVMINYFIILFSVVVDLFRNDETSGIAKAIWIVALLLVPFITLLVYIILNSSGMARRNVAARGQARDAQADYVRELVGPQSASDQIATAQKLLASGAISQAEFDTLKAKALAS